MTIIIFLCVSHWCFFVHEVRSVTFANGLLVLTVGLFLFFDHTHNVFPVDEGLKATDCCHVVQWKHVFGLDWLGAIVLVRLHDDHSGSEIY